MWKLTLIVLLASPASPVLAQYLVGNTPADGDCADGQIQKYSAPLKKFVCQLEGASGGIPSGSILLTLAAACPAGFTAVTALNGRTLVGTLEAAKDVGGTGGSDTVAPAGGNSAPALTMNAYTPAGTNGTSTVTPLGSVASIAASGTAASKIGTSAATGAASNHTHGAPAFTGLSSTVAAQMFTGAQAALTGSVAAPAFTGTQFDNRSAFVRVIFCSKD
jgi:hypothetical protein